MTYFCTFAITFVIIAAFQISSFTDGTALAATALLFFCYGLSVGRYTPPL